MKIKLDMMMRLGLAQNCLFVTCHLILWGIDGTIQKETWLKLKQDCINIQVTHMPSSFISPRHQTVL